MGLKSNLVWTDNHTGKKFKFTCMLVRRSRIPPTAMHDSAGNSNSENARGQWKTNFNTFVDLIIINIDYVIITRL